MNILKSIGIVLFVLAIYNITEHPTISAVYMVWFLSRMFESDEKPVVKETIEPTKTMSFGTKSFGGRN